MVEQFLLVISSFSFSDLQIWKRKGSFSARYKKLGKLSLHTQDRIESNLLTRPSSLQQGERILLLISDFSSPGRDFDGDAGGGVLVEILVESW